MSDKREITKVHQVLSLNLMPDGTTCLDIDAELDGVRQLLHIPGGPLEVLPDSNAVPPVDTTNDEI